MNFTSHQISKQIGKIKRVSKAKGKKELAMASSEAINKAIKCFFHEKKGHLKRNCTKYEKSKRKYPLFSYIF